MEGSDDASTLDETGVKKIILQFEKKALKNQVGNTILYEWLSSLS